MNAKKKIRYWHTNPNTPHPDLGSFDRTILFSCFSPWVESIREQYKTDPAKAALAFLVLADYCLYGIEPDPTTNPWGMAWRSIKHDADSSIKNRSRRFGTEDIDKHEQIIRFYLEHPDATQREIVAATGCSLGLVNKVVKKLKSVDSSGACSIDYSSNSNPRGPVLEQSTVTCDNEPSDYEVFGPPLPDAQGTEVLA